jgi:hypothetical protein
MLLELITHTHGPRIYTIKKVSTKGDMWFHYPFFVRGKRRNQLATSAQSHCSTQLIRCLQMHLCATPKQYGI